MEENKGQLSFEFYEEHFDSKMNCSTVDAFNAFIYLGQQLSKAGVSPDVLSATILENTEQEDVVVDTEEVDD